MSATRAFGFGHPEQGLWGVAWTPAADGEVSLALGGPSLAAVLSATLAGAHEDEDWRLEGEGIELALTASGVPATHAGAAGFDQLCGASGSLIVDGSEHKVDAVGWRGVRNGQLELDRIESFRLLAAWFDPDDGLALTALRPGGARGQDADLVTASVLEPPPTRPVAEPRLSTTYTRDGLPARAGLELWFEEPADDEPDGDEREHFPRRAAGEAISAGLDWRVDGFAVHAAPFRWHSRGRDGAGFYLLGRCT